MLLGAFESFVGVIDVEGLGKVPSRGELSVELVVDPVDLLVEIERVRLQHALACVYFLLHFDIVIAFLSL